MSSAWRTWKPTAVEQMLPVGHANQRHSAGERLGQWAKSIVSTAKYILVYKQRAERKQKDMVGDVLATGDPFGARIQVFMSS